jgi:hypothetical protein
VSLSLRKTPLCSGRDKSAPCASRETPRASPSIQSIIWYFGFGFSVFNLKTYEFPCDCGCWPTFLEIPLFPDHDTSLLLLLLRPDKSCKKHQNQKKQSTPMICVKSKEEWSNQTPTESTTRPVGRTKQREAPGPWRPTPTAARESTQFE